MQYCSVVDFIEGSDTICCCTIDADVDVDAGLMFFSLLQSKQQAHSAIMFIMRFAHAI